MDLQPTAPDTRTILRRDILFACSMVLVFCLFITGTITAVLWGSSHAQKLISSSATATAAAHRTEQANYQFIDTFDGNDEYWLTESSDDEFSKQSISINGGVYLWDIMEVKQPFLHWSNFHGASRVEDFDIYVDSKIKPADNTPGDFCSGFVFRTASADWEEGAYTFSVCNDSFFDVEYYQQGDWEPISDWTYSESIQVSEWNRLEVSARGSHFTFIINDEIVFEMTDDRLPQGGLGLLIEVSEERPVSIWFDNFGYEER